MHTGRRLNIASKVSMEQEHKKTIFEKYENRENKCPSKELYRTCCKKKIPFLTLILTFRNDDFARPPHHEKN